MSVSMVVVDRFRPVACDRRKEVWSMSVESYEKEYNDMTLRKGSMGRVKALIEKIKIGLKETEKEPSLSTLFVRLDKLKKEAEWLQLTWDSETRRDRHPFTDIFVLGVSISTDRRL